MEVHFNPDGQVKLEEITSTMIWKEVGLFRARKSERISCSARNNG